MYKLSNLAVEDFAAIYQYTLLNFGAAQADNFLFEQSAKIVDYWAKECLKKYPPTTL